MTTKNIYLQDSSSNNLLPITDWSNLLNVPSVLQSTDKILTNDNLKLTTHSLSIQSDFSGIGKVLTFQLGGVPFWSIGLVVSPKADWAAYSTSPLCATPDISNDAALSGLSYTLDWKYLAANVWQNTTNPFTFAFRDGYGYLDGGQTIPKGFNIMVFGTQMFI